MTPTKEEYVVEALKRITAFSYSWDNFGSMSGENPHISNAIQSAIKVELETMYDVGHASDGTTEDVIQNSLDVRQVYHDKVDANRSMASLNDRTPLTGD